MEQTPPIEVVMAAASATDLEKRGYDDRWQTFPAYGYCVTRWAGLTDESGRPRAVFEELVRSTFAAITELAGFASESQALDPADLAQRCNVQVVALEIEDLARALRVALAAEASDRAA